MLNEPVLIQLGLPAAILSTATLGLICQFVQTTDDVFPLMYFTVDSVAFAGIVAGLALIRPAAAQLPLLRASAAVSVLLSALVFATVIAPASDTGTWIQPHDDYWIRAATFLFHLAMPVLVTVDFVVQDSWRVPLRLTLYSAFAWPMVYVSTLCVLVWSGSASMPYPFLDRTHIGEVAVVGVLIAVGCLVLVLTTALWAGNRWLNGNRAARKLS